MRYCKRCLEPDARADSIFDNDGICLPCRYAEQADEIDWAARREELSGIVEWAKARNVSGYDCIVSASGGKDSLRQAMICRELGMNPLLVSCGYPPAQQTERGAYNLANLVKIGFDCIYVNSGPETWRSMARESFRRWGNFYKSSELLIYVVAPRVAIMYQIPLIIYGENPNLWWGDYSGSLDGDASQVKYGNTLQGGEMEWMIDEGADPNRLFWYRYPDESEFEAVDLRMIFLGYYFENFHDCFNGPYAIEHGLKIREGADAAPENCGQLTPFDALDCDFVAVNQMIKRLKFGAGKVSQQCSGAIRAGHMTRDEALEYMKYDGCVSSDIIRRFCDYIKVDEREFWDVCEKYRNLDLWEKNETQWKLKFPPK